MLELFFSSMNKNNGFLMKIFTTKPWYSGGREQILCPVAMFPLAIEADSLDF